MIRSGKSSTIGTRNDGGLDKDEFEHVLLAVGVDAAAVTGLFASADLDRNGKIDFEEFLIWIKGSAPAAIREEAYAGHGDYGKNDGEALVAIDTPLDPGKNDGEALIAIESALDPISSDSCTIGVPT